jgi:hypothetical protein
MGTFDVPAENVGGTWMLTLPTGIRVRLGDVLTVMGFKPKWEANTGMVVADRG